MSNTQKKLCITSLDPSDLGGVLSMLSFFYRRSKEESLNPFVAYNIVTGSEKHELTTPKLLKGNRPEIYKKNIENMETFGIDRIMPEFEFFNYILNIKKWKKVLSKADLFFCVSGFSLPSLPLAILDKKFAIWIATPLKGDRLDRIKKESFFRKIRDYLSLPILFLMERYTLKKAKKIFALSNYTKKSLIEDHNIDKSKIDVVYQPIDINLFKPTSFKKRKNNYLIFTGRIEDDRKNIPMLLKTFSSIVRQYPKIKLKLIGGNGGDKYLSIVSDLNIKDNIDFISNVPRKKLVKYYQNALAFALPSFQEGLCISALEAMSCGIPVVSTKCGGPEDYIKNGYNGFLVDNNNVEDMVDKIKKIIELNDKDREKMSKNSRDYILDNFTEEKIWSKFEKVLYEL